MSNSKWSSVSNRGSMGNSKWGSMSKSKRSSMGNSKWGSMSSMGNSKWGSMSNSKWSSVSNSSTRSINTSYQSMSKKTMAIKTTSNNLSISISSGGSKATGDQGRQNNK